MFCCEPALVVQSDIRMGCNSWQEAAFRQPVVHAGTGCHIRGTQSSPENRGAMGIYGLPPGCSSCNYQASTPAACGGLDYRRPAPHTYLAETIQSRSWGDVAGTGS